MFRIERPLAEPLRVMRQTFLRTLVPPPPWPRRRSWAVSTMDCRPSTSAPVVSSNILFTSFRVGLPEAACSTPMLLVYSLGRRSRTPEGSPRMWRSPDTSARELDDRTGRVLDHPFRRTARRVPQLHLCPATPGPAPGTPLRESSYPRCHAR